MGIVVNNGQVCFSGCDAASFHYHTCKGRGRVAGVFSWLFRRKVSVPESVVVNQIWPNRDAAFIKSYLKSKKASMLGANRSRNLAKQQYGKSCTARSLQLIANELGIKHLPRNSRYMFTGQPIDDPSVETAIYAITARLLDSRGQLKPELGGSVANGGYSGPVGVKNAVKALGLDSHFYCSSRLIDRYYMKHKSSEWEEIKRCCSMHRSSPPSLCSNERLLVHVCNYSIVRGVGNSLKPKRDHCVVMRPDGSCYDPCLGRNYGSLKEYSKISGMSPSGIYTLISSKRGYEKLPSVKNGSVPASAQYQERLFPGRPGVASCS